MLASYPSGSYRRKETTTLLAPSTHHVHIAESQLHYLQKGEVMRSPWLLTSLAPGEVIDVL